MTTTTSNTTHEVPEFGLPYAPAGYDTATGNATATCPTCGHVSHASTPKGAAAKYGRHFTAEAKAGR